MSANTGHVAPSVRAPRLARALGAALLAAIAGSALAAAERYELDPSHTSASFLIDHVGYSKVIGRFDEVAGEFDFDAGTGTLSGLRVSVATASVDTGHAARDEHVRNADFLDVERHPEMVFEAGPVEVPVGGDAELAGAAGTLEGTLTLLGRTRPVTLEYTLNKAADYPFGHGDFTLGVSLRGTLSRSDWGMDYGVGNGLVGDAVELLLETEANRR